MATELVAQSRELVEISETELRKAESGGVEPGPGFGFRFLHDTWLVTWLVTNVSEARMIPKCCFSYG